MGKTGQPNPMRRDYNVLDYTETVCFLVIEADLIHPYVFSGKTTISFGRKTAHSIPDLPSVSPSVSRNHGSFIKINDTWFYCDKGSINGTYVQGKKVKPGLNGRISPVILNHGDIIKVASPSKSEAPVCWILFLERHFANEWRYAPLKQRSISFGTGRKDNVRFLNHSTDSLYASVSKSTDGWTVSSRCNEVKINNKPLYLSETITLRNYDCLWVHGYFFIFVNNGFYYMKANAYQLNSSKFLAL